MWAAAFSTLIITSLTANSFIPAAMGHEEVKAYMKKMTPPRVFHRRRRAMFPHCPDFPSPP
jgi:hypothetical protein